MREISNHEIDNVNGAMSVGEGLAGLAVVAGAGAIIGLAPFAAGAVLIGVIGISAIDIYTQLQ